MSQPAAHVAGVGAELKAVAHAQQVAPLTAEHRIYPLRRHDAVCNSEVEIINVGAELSMEALYY